MLFLKSPLRFASILVVGLSALLIVSCADDKKSDAGSENSNNLVGQQGSATMTLPCLKLTKQQIQAWVDSGWTKPSDPAKLIKKMLLQFYSADPSDIANNMSLYVYPARSYTDVYVGGRVTLTIDTSCAALPLTGPAVFANNFANFKNLKITDSIGNLKNFSHIRFIPKVNPGQGQYVSFELEVVSIGANSQEQVEAKEGSDPCPPYCPDGDDGF